MKYSFLIFGAGAIGTYLGAYLAEAGHHVTFLEREADLPFLKRNGVQIEREGIKTTFKSPHFIHDLSQLSEWELDLGILAVKTYHLESMLPELADHKNNLPPLLCLQNGVESEEQLRQALGENQVIPGTVTSAVDRRKKGDIILRKERGMALAGVHPRAEEFAEVFQSAGIKCHYQKDPHSVKWSKLILNLLGNASSAILDLPPAEIFNHPGLYKMEIEGIREALRVMKAREIKLVNLPGVPVRFLAAIIQSLPAMISQPFLSRLIGRGRGEKMPSFHIDLYSGRGRSEVDQLNGAVARAGEALSIPTPVNQLLSETLLDLTRGKIPLDSYTHNPDRLLEKLP